MGKKKQPIYKVVAADERSPRDGRIIEALGLYNPITDPATVEIKEDRVLYWLGVGAQPTTTVKGLLSQKGILYRRELIKSGLSEEEVNLKIDEWLKQQEAKLSVKVEKKAIAKAKKQEVKEEVVAEEQVTTEEEVKEESEEVTEGAAEEKLEKNVPEAEGAASEEGSEEEKAEE